MNIANIFLSLAYFISVVKSVKILGIFSSPGYSQFILCEKLMAELARRGHMVTVISAYQPKNNISNYRTILVETLLEETPGGVCNFFGRENNDFISNDILFYNSATTLTEMLLSHEDVQKLLHSNETFDLVIVEQFGNEAHLGFSTHFNAPLISFSSVGLSDWNSHLIGNVRLPSLVPLTATSFTAKMNFLERLQNTFINLVDLLYKRYIYFPRQQEIMNKYFPKTANLEEIIQNVSLLLLNSHVATTEPELLTSAAKEIGGFHIGPTKELPGDVQDFLDQADSGAIFFSMGSNIRAKDTPKEMIEAFLKVFSKMDQKFLWKFDEPNILNVPKNVMLSKWLPQSDILAHPNIVAFITHGGLLSTTESIFHGVPMICIPIFGDQKMNVAKSVRKGIAVLLPLQKLTERTLHLALREVIDNSRYRNNSKWYSKIMKDQMVQPLDTAMYWIEHVIKFGGAHLKSSSMDLHWFQIYLLDQIALVVIASITLYYLSQLILKKIFNIGNNGKTFKKQGQKLKTS